MPEVTFESAGRRVRAGWPGLAFWILATGGLALFALGVLSPPYIQRLEVHEQLALAEAKVHQARQVTDDLQIVHDNLDKDPQGVARQIRKDLGYRRSGEEPLPFEPQAMAPALEDPTPADRYETRLDRLCRLFGSPVLSLVSLVAGLMLVAVALICFDVPTVQKQTVAVPKPPS